MLISQIEINSTSLTLHPWLCIVATSCFSTLAESVPKCFPVKIWSVKSLPSKKRFVFLTSLTILDNLVHPGKYIKSLVVLSKFENFTPKSFGFTPLIILGPWCMAACHQNHGNHGNSQYRSPRIIG